MRTPFNVATPKGLSFVLTRLDLKGLDGDPIESDRCFLDSPRSERG